MSGTATKNLHVPLPDSLYRRLRTESERTKRPATELAREAIDQWLAERQRLAVHESIVEYARKHARTGADLDEELEAAAVEHLQSLDLYNVSDRTK